jgi:hypothetical protein
MFNRLSEKDKRLYAGVEALKFSYGGISYIVQLYFTRSRIAFSQKAGSARLAKYQGRVCALYGCYSGNLR